MHYSKSINKTASSKLSIFFFSFKRKGEDEGKGGKDG